GLMQALGAAFVLGAPLRHRVLFEDRFTRRFSLDCTRKFFTNPCELAPLPEPTHGSPLSNGQAAGKQIALHSAVLSSKVAESEGREGGMRQTVRSGSSDFPLELVRELVAKRAELPVSTVHDDNRVLSELHLNSITVGQLVSEAAQLMGLPRMVGLTDFAN